jgi:hypothetical protein
MPWQRKDDELDKPGLIAADKQLMGHDATYETEKLIGIRDERGYKLLQKLKPKHHRLVELYLKGVRPKDIAAELGVNTHTLWGWLRDPLIQHEIDKGKKAWEDEFDSLYGLAIDAVRGGLNELDPQHRLRAAAIYFRQKQDTAALKAGGGKETAEDVIARMLQINIQINQQEQSK